MAERPTSRREFLHGKSAAEAVRGIVPEGLDEQFNSPSGVQLTLSRRAMACEFEVRLNASAQQNETEAAMAALDLVEQIEDRLTVYREESELLRLNQSAYDTEVSIDGDILQLLLLANRLHAETQAAYDVTAGPLSRVWGFSRREGRLPGTEEIDAALETVGWQHVQLDSAAKTVRFTKQGIGVDFNSSGKGHALDQMAKLLLLESVEDFLLHGGRSTLLARGAPAGSDPDRPGWGVGVRHPLRPQVRLAEFMLVDQAFSTSGSATQCFVHRGRRYGHLIDPRTGWPAEGLHSVSVVTPAGPSGAAEADALSTALYVMGHEAGLAYLASRPEVGALFVLPGSSPSEVRLETANLSDACWQPHEAP